MMRLRRASTLVTLYVLASAATASAECAWVLWKADHISEVHWSREAVFDTRSACVRSIDAKAAKIGLGVPYRRADPSTALNKRGFRSSETLLGEEGFSGALWQCLPDTILTSAAPTAVSCAWVLWNGTLYERRSMEKAIRLDAFESSAACVRDIDAREAEMRRLFFDVTRSSPTALLTSRAAQVDKMECLPDTVDPRGPKGK